MRVLFLLREPSPGMRRYAANLKSALIERGITVESHEASSWMPAATGPQVDEEVTPMLRDVGSSFDLVHAWGYRTAWACGACYGDREAWVYGAYALPKSTHRFLIGHLNSAQAGICASRAIFRAIDEALGIDLEVVYPGIPPVSPEISRDESREALRIDEDTLAIGGIGRFEAEKSFSTLISAFAKLKAGMENARLFLAGKGAEETVLREQISELGLEGQATFFGWQDDPLAWMAAMDILCLPSKRIGFSSTAVEAMALGVPVLARHTGAIHEIIDPDVTGFLSKDDESFAETLVEIADLPLTLETVGRAGKIRSLDQFTIDRAADRHAEIYERVVGE